MVDKYHIDFHLTRGPAQLPRSFTLPLNEYNSQTQLFTVGRAVRCNVILDPLLVFASNVQCSICCVPRQGYATTEHLNNDNNHNNNSTNKESTNDRRYITENVSESNGNDNINDMTEEKSAKPSEEFPFKVYLTDMCSSNGTFVNSIRISTSEPTLLHNDDCVIFGGLRDVDIGEKLPNDAFDVCDELIVWKVKMCEENSEQLHFASAAASTTTNTTDSVIVEFDSNTPNGKYTVSSAKRTGNNNNDVVETKSTTLPSAERLEKEERALLELVQETLLLKRSACKTSPKEDLQVSSLSNSRKLLEKYELSSLSSSFLSAAKKQNVTNANASITSNVTNEYSPMVKQQLFTTDTPLRTDTENYDNEKRVSENKNSSYLSNVPLRETTANIMQSPSSSSSSSSLAAATSVNLQMQQQHYQTRMKNTTGKQSRKSELLLSSSSLSSSSPSSHNVELPPPPLPFSAVRVGKFTFNASHCSEICQCKSEQRIDMKYKDNGQNKSLKRVRSEEQVMHLSCAEPTAQITTQELPSLETCAIQEAIVERENINFNDTHNGIINVTIKSNREDVLSHNQEEHVVQNKDGLYTLSFTSTHWKWKMGNVADDKRTTMNVLLPITSIATLLVCCGGKYCEEHEGSASVNNNRACDNNEKNTWSAGSANYNCTANSNSAHYAGIAVELKNHCQVPLLPKELTQGAKENRWIAWKLKLEPQCKSISQLPKRTETENHDSQSDMLEKANTSANLLLSSNETPTHHETSNLSESNNNNKKERKVSESSSIRNEGEFINVSTKRDEDNIEHCDNDWVTVLEKYYEVHNFPKPLYVSVDTFEKVFDPSCLTKTDNIENNYSENENEEEHAYREWKKALEK